MDSLFAKHGLTVIDLDRMPIGDDMAKPWTRMQIMAAEDIIENAIIPAAEKDSEASPTAERWREIFEGLAKRCQDGMSITMDMVVAVGRKGGS